MSREKKNNGTKRFLTTREAVDEGFFTSMRAAANMRHKRTGPAFIKADGAPPMYEREALEVWIRAGRVRTREEIRRSIDV